MGQVAGLAHKKNRVRGKTGVETRQVDDYIAEQRARDEHALKFPEALKTRAFFRMEEAHAAISVG
jgi:hypothetical protein